MKEARREKIRNKTRERERERRGEVFKAVRERQAKGPPAHVLARMSPERRRLDKVVRSLSEVGYVAMVKKKLGFRLKDDETWRVFEEAAATLRTSRLLTHLDLIHEIRHDLLPNTLHAREHSRYAGGGDGACVPLRGSQRSASRTELPCRANSVSSVALRG